MLDEFVQSLRKEDLAASTVKGYRYDLTMFLRWFRETQGPRSSLAELTEIDLTAYKQHLVRGKRQRPASVNRRLQAVRRFCRWAHRRGVLRTNVSEKLKMVRSVPRRRPAGLTGAEVHALLRAAGRTTHGLAKRNYALVQIFVQAGLRVSESAAARVDDVTIRDRAGSVRIQGKGTKEREVPLNASARRALRTYLDARDNPKGDEPLFTSGRGAGISVRAVEDVISNLARRAKIDRIAVSPHSLRHTFALNYLHQNPGKLVELANLMGHDSLDTTALYTQPSTEELSDDLERSRLNVYDE